MADKNAREIAGTTLIEHTVKTALAADAPDGAAFTHIVLLQPTNPFTTADDIDKAVALWRKSGKSSLASVTWAAHSPRFVVSRSRKTGNQIREGKDNDRWYEANNLNNPIRPLKDVILK